MRAKAPALSVHTFQGRVNSVQYLEKQAMPEAAAPLHPDSQHWLWHTAPMALGLMCRCLMVVGVREIVHLLDQALDLTVLTAFCAAPCAKQRASTSRTTSSTPTTPYVTSTF